MRRLPHLLLIPLLSLATGSAFATDAASGMSFAAESGAAGGAMMNTVAGSVNSITGLLMGPGLYVIMAIGALLALYGFGRGNKETLFSGIGLFVLAAIIKGVFAIL